MVKFSIIDNFNSIFLCIPGTLIWDSFQFFIIRKSFERYKVPTDNRELHPNFTLIFLYIFLITFIFSQFSTPEIQIFQLTWVTWTTNATIMILFTIKLKSNLSGSPSQRSFEGTTKACKNTKRIKNEIHIKIYWNLKILTDFAKIPKNAKRFIKIVNPQLIESKIG